MVGLTVYFLKDYSNEITCSLDFCLFCFFFNGVLLTLFKSLYILLRALSSGTHVIDVQRGFNDTLLTFFWLAVCHDVFGNIDGIIV